MRLLLALSAAALALLVALLLPFIVGGSSLAEAHVGAAIAKADFQHPAPPLAIKNADGTTTWSYAAEEADGSFDIKWVDGDIDPTANFTFYYFDHALPNAVSADEVESTGALLHDRAGNPAASIWASCTCTAAMGIVCPDAGVRSCPNDFLWDTSSLPAGAYWVAAVNNDPPYHVYNTTLAPVRVSHGGPKPPVLLVLRPDGLMGADTEYDVTLIAIGSGAMTVDIDYGFDSLSRVLGPTTNLVTALPVKPAADGTFVYRWDLTSLADDVYFIQATLHDASGIVTFSDSLYGLGVYHPGSGDGGADAAPSGADLATLHPAHTSGGCSTGGRPASTGTAPLGLAGLMMLVVAVASRRRVPRGGPRSG